MKIFSCHIENFGKLSNVNIDFSEKLTVIKEDNSFGKTTLADFITNMFYDLPDLRVRDLSNDRRRYDPWQGGVFGGSLTFEYKGIKYIIERDFSKNAFRLINTSSVAKKEVSQIDGKAVYSDNLGEVLFGISRNSFKRSAYIPQDEIICNEVESGLNDKLRNIIHATDENHSLDKSLGILQKAVESIETKRGNKGKLKEVYTQIKELSDKISYCDICFSNAEQERKDLNTLKNHFKEIEYEIEKTITKSDFKTREIPFVRNKSITAQ